uniref:Hint domain-containing protein n=1 Tax=Compsopogon caeruleus TaxID=31354 RepID=A0A7S1XFJ1_9RHOD|mmetsp:Transcript_3263/g.6130  ORF Transcript_3263/g.6130 Transcript_3263/m.6130 type:complete len:637 (+) Transcript_3263:126-2036(+)
MMKLVFSVVVLVALCVGWSAGQECRDGSPPGPRRLCQSSSFEDVTARNMDWTSIFLQSSSFGNVVFRGMTLVRASLHMTTWQGANVIDGGNWSLSVWDGSLFYGTLMISSTVMQRFSFSGVDANQADIISLTGIQGQNCVVSGSDFRYLLAQDSNLSACNFAGSYFGLFSIFGGSLKDANLAGVEMIGANFSDVDLSGTSFAGAKVSNAQFYRVNANLANFAGAVLNRITIQGGRYDNANFSGASIQNSKISFRGQSVIFVGANLSNTDLSGVQLPGADFAGADLSGVDLSGANLSSANLVGAVNVTGANFEGADLSGAEGTPTSTPSQTPTPASTATAPSTSTASQTPVPTQVALTSSPQMTPSMKTETSTPFSPTPLSLTTNLPMASSTTTPFPVPTQSPSGVPSTVASQTTGAPESPPPGNVTVSPGANETATPNVTVQIANGTESPTDDGSVCFPGDATVELESGKVISMHELVIGDRIKGAGGRIDEVFMFGHRIRHGEFPFISLRSSQGSEITMSFNHLIFEVRRNGLVRAGYIAPGDLLLGCEGQVIRVDTVSRIFKQGLFNPHTFSGEIVVNGILASTYNSFLPAQLAHNLLLPERCARRLGFSFIGGVLEGSRPALFSLALDTVSFS